MKREKWNQKTDLRQDPAESVSGVYEEKTEYTLEEILSEFSGDWDSGTVDQTVWDGEALSMSEFDPYLFDTYEQPAVKPAAKKKPAKPAGPSAPAVQIDEEESQIAAESVAPEALQTPEVTADPAEAASENNKSDSLKNKESAARVKPEKAEKTGKNRKERKNRRKKQQIVEDFPDSPPEEMPVDAGDVDYTALFRMFADPEPGETAPMSAEAQKSPDGVEQDRKSEAPSAPEPGEERPHIPAEEPLFAENSPDFRDILREFMLGDQHPIYADMPGIGKKAGGAHAADDALADLDAAINSVIPKAYAIPKREERKPKPKPAAPVEPVISDDAEQKQAEAAPASESGGKSRRKLNLNLNLRSRLKSKPEPESVPAPAPEKKTKEYFVEEDFPPEAPQEELPTEPDVPDGSWELLDKESDVSVPAGETPADSGDADHELKAETPEAPGPEEETEETEEEEEPAGRLRKLLRGLGESRPGRKRALNEPKAYASFEDYVPSGQEKPETAPSGEDKPAGEGEAKAEAGQTPEPYDTYNPEEDDEILYSGDFPSFGQWILNELMTLWIRLNGIGNRESTATMEDDSEDLGKEVNVANASRYYGSQVTMLRMRFQIGLVILAILAYLTLGLPVSGMLKTAKVSAAMCLGLQLTIMLLCLDVVTNAAVNLTRRRFGADQLAVLACLISSFDALIVAVGGFGTPHIPLCLFSSLALMGILLSSLLSARALRKSTRVPAIGKRVYCVTAEEGVRAKGDLTLLKSVRPSAGFVRRAEETPPDEALFSRSALLQLLVAMLLSLLTGLVKHSMGDYLYILSAILSCAVPVTALLAFALPFFIGSGRIFSSAAGT